MVRWKLHLIQDSALPNSLISHTLTVISCDNDSDIAKKYSIVKSLYHITFTFSCIVLCISTGPFILLLTYIELEKVKYKNLSDTSSGCFLIEIVHLMLFLILKKNFKLSVKIVVWGVQDMIIVSESLNKEFKILECRPLMHRLMQIVAAWSYFCIFLTSAPDFISSFE